MHWQKETLPISVTTLQPPLCRLWNHLHGSQWVLFFSTLGKRILICSISHTHCNASIQNCTHRSCYTKITRQHYWVAVIEGRINTIQDLCNKIMQTCKPISFWLPLLLAVAACNARIPKILSSVSMSPVCHTQHSVLLPFLPQNLQQRVSQSQLRTSLTAVYQLVVLHTTQLVRAFPAGTFISNFQQPLSKWKSLSVWGAFGALVLIYALGEEVN